MFPQRDGDGIGIKEKSEFAGHFRLDRIQAGAGKKVASRVWMCGEQTLLVERHLSARSCRWRWLYRTLIDCIRLPQYPGLVASISSTHTSPIFLQYATPSSRRWRSRRRSRTIMGAKTVEYRQEHRHLLRHPNCHQAIHGKWIQSTRSHARQSHSNRLCEWPDTRRLRLQSCPAVPCTPCGPPMAA